MFHLNKVSPFISLLSSLIKEWWPLIGILLLFPHFSYGGIGDGLTDQQKVRLFKALKKINVRLTEMETQNLARMQESQSHLQETQGLILMQIEGLQKIIPQMQGTIEQNQATLEERIATLANEVDQIRFQGEKDRIQIQTEWKTLREQVGTQLEIVRQGLAQDIETLGKQNKQFLEGMQNANKETLGKVIISVDQQRNRLDETQKVIKEKLIPAIEKQSRQNRDAMQNALGKTEAKTQGIIDILKKSFNAQKTSNENFQTQFKTLNDNQKKANDNTIAIGRSITDIRGTLNQKLPKLKTFTTRAEANQKQITNNMKVIDDNTRKIAEGLKVLGSNFNNLGQSVNTLHANMAKMEEQSKNHAEKLMERNQQTLDNISKSIHKTINQVDQSMQSFGGGPGEKLTKIIEILEIQSRQSDSIDARLDQFEKNIQDNQNNEDLANQKLVKLIEILKTLVSTQTKIEQSLLQQVESMADLKRKANVNISRNDDIKKIQKEIKKSLKQSSSRKNVTSKK